VELQSLIHDFVWLYFSQLLLNEYAKFHYHMLNDLLCLSNQLAVPVVKSSTFGARSFLISMPSVWNTLPDYLRDPTLSIETLLNAS